MYFFLPLALKGTDKASTPTHGHSNVDWKRARIRETRGRLARHELFLGTR